MCLVGVGVVGVGGGEGGGRWLSWEGNVGKGGKKREDLGDVRLLSEKDEIGLSADQICRPFWGSINLAHDLCLFLSIVSTFVKVSGSSAAKYSDGQLLLCYLSLIVNFQFETATGGLHFLISGYLGVFCCLGCSLEFY